MNQTIKILGFSCLMILIMQSCSHPKGDNPGSEFMPDMAHSIAYEANIYNYYYNNTWDDASVKKLKELATPGTPIPGTIARGYAGVHTGSTATKEQAVKAMKSVLKDYATIPTPVNGTAPYHYEDTEEERTRAMKEIIYNPFPVSDKGLAKGKELYNINCGICHGEKGNGNGYLVAEENPNAKYPAQPANFLTDEFVAASNGRYYHSIMYGKNVMGGYSDKLSYEERWYVIQYIRLLQAKDRKMVYTADANTLNDTDVPVNTLVQLAELEKGEGQGADAHGHEGGGGAHKDEHGHDSDHHEDGHGKDGEHHGEGHEHEGDKGHGKDH